MGPAEIRDFLAWLVNECNVAASKQNQALHSILFLYIELEVNQITVRGGKGDKDRGTMGKTSGSP